MRFFDTEKNYIGTSYDTSLNTIKGTDINNYYFEYIIDQEKISHFEHVETIHHEGFPDSYIDEEIIDQEESGHWSYVGNYSGEDVPDVPNDIPHESKYFVKETVCIIRPYTEEELEEMQRQIDDAKAKEQEAELQDELIKGLGEFEDDTAESICDLYEMINESVKINKTSHAIAKMYARRILAGEITLEDVPESLREEVRKILEENK